MANASDKLRNDMERVLRNLHAELHRVEIMAAALDAFSAPVPDYEPTFRHLALAHALDRHELRGQAICEC